MNKAMIAHIKRNPWMRAYSGAKSRCENPNNSLNYKRYGAKGIKFLMTKEDFKFLWFRDKAALMKSPSIDRIDASSHYTVDNCQFIERSENCGKKRTNKINFEIAQEIRSERRAGKTTVALAAKYGVSTSFISSVCKNKWYVKPGNSAEGERQTNERAGRQ
jgi:hypothetical protein